MLGTQVGTEDDSHMMLMMVIVMVMMMVIVMVMMMVIVMV